MKKLVFVLALIFTFASASAASSAFAQANESKITIDHNERPGESEQISLLGIELFGQGFQVIGPLTTDGSDKSSISQGIQFDSQLAELIVPLNNKSSGHKLDSGTLITLKLADGSTHTLGKTSGSAVEDGYGFAYSMNLDANPNIKISSRSAAGPIQKSFFRNALAVCMEQDFQDVKTQVVMEIDGHTLSQTTQSTRSIGSERWAPGKCKGK